MITGQYDSLYVGNPRAVAYLSGSSANTVVGDICSGPWQDWHTMNNADPGLYDFNCIPPVNEVNQNATTNGYQVGGLNRNGSTVAICTIQNGPNQLCDIDMVVNANDKACGVSLVCM